MRENVSGFLDIRLGTGDTVSELTNCFRALCGVAMDFGMNETSSQISKLSRLDNLLG
jgi:hypothetical protein